ncbi:TIGR02646 family protein [Mesorhizobium sp. ESP7-2]|uniref:retron system putative HNH endonuclease n=1 Tax=Mesorhizobium sp. ESP7-2 TaxID=2876622 RepID=UPI001CCD2A33|nr:retron system putative HNH endonuclease [Mesorhizobium sp. ESP7-2]MBZ9711160.1 TIGR02646 family protein [Mesorhizobium sp. ESP7-2]
MRKIEKRPKPQILRDNEEVWTTELLAEAPGSSEAKTIQKRYGHVQIRNTLRSETKHKCAYCESHIENSGYSHIEHIKPKDVHRELTFLWDNLTLGCTRCNTNKGNTDPTTGNFVHPYKDAPENEFSFIGSFMSPRPGNVAALNMINWLDLNRAGLIISRTEVMHRVRDIYLQAVALPLDARREFINLAVGALTSEERTYSRVAECTAKAYEQEFAQLLEN